jgi:hypothetical protein
MNFVPLFGRWATLLMAVAIAVGATALSLSVHQKLKSEEASSSDKIDQVGVGKSPWTENESASVQRAASDRIIVVNPDGSVRNNETRISSNEGGGEEPIEDYSPSVSNRELAMPEAADKNRPARRIE